MPSLEEIARSVAGVPFMSPEQGRVVFEHVRSSGARQVLELGTAHGVGTAYLAGAAEHVTTVDFAGATYDPSPEQTLARAGVADRVTIERRYSSYTWWLKTKVAERSDGHGNCEPLYDLVYLDGAKNFTIDGLAVVLAEKLLRPGGWLLMDDLFWRYGSDREVTDGVHHRELSAEERAEPHLKAVFDLIVRQHPSFTETKIQDEWWGWARKAPGEPRRHTVETSRPLGALVAGAARRAVRRLRP